MGTLRFIGFWGRLVGSTLALSACGEATSGNADGGGDDDGDGTSSTVGSGEGAGNEGGAGGESVGGSGGAGTSSSTTGSSASSTGTGQPTCGSEGEACTDGCCAGLVCADALGECQEPCDSTSDCGAGECCGWVGGDQVCVSTFVGVCGLDCAEGDLQCSASTLLDQCEYGFWVSYNCQDLCVNAGYQSTTGCEAGNADDTCYCSDAPPCTPGEAQCYGSDVQVCQGDQLWTTFDCDQVCQDAGWDYSASCGYSQQYGDELCFCDYYECVYSSDCPGDCQYGDNYVCCPLCISNECDFTCTYF